MLTFYSFIKIVVVLIKNSMCDIRGMNVLIDREKNI